MKFYSDFSDKYDVMITWKRREDIEGPFFRRVFCEHSVKSVLDCSCGTGFHVIMLSKMGYRAEGCDISPEMIDKSRLNAVKEGLNLNFVQSDFKEMVGKFDKKFDCIICMGNSLPHEFGDENISLALENMYDLLGGDNDDNGDNGDGGGIVIIDQRNFEKMVKNKKRFIPIHYHKEKNGDRKIFIYALDFLRDKITFNVISFLEFDGVPKFEVNSTDYNPISKDKLSDLMKRAGFSELRFYGDFDFKEFDENQSDVLIVVGCKKGPNTPFWKEVLDEK